MVRSAYGPGGGPLATDVPRILDDVTLSRRAAAFLLGVAVWNVATYANFAKNLADSPDDHPTGYYVAHTALIVVNLGIAAVLGTLGWRALRARAVR